MKKILLLIVGGFLTYSSCLVSPAQATHAGFFFVNTIKHQSEIQSINFSTTPSTGAFQLVLGSQTSTALSYSAAALDVQNALAALSNVGSGKVTVTGSISAGFVVTFNISLGNLPQMTVVSNSLTSGGTGAYVYTGIQGGSTTSGYWTLTVNGVQSGQIPVFNLPGGSGSASNTSDVAAALNQIPGVSVSVASSTGDPGTIGYWTGWYITFISPKGPVTVAKGAQAAYNGSFYSNPSVTTRTAGVAGPATTITVSTTQDGA
jgi:hypothetical protein